MDQKTIEKLIEHLLGEVAIGKQAQAELRLNERDALKAREVFDRHVSAVQRLTVENDLLKEEIKTAKQEIEEYKKAIETLESSITYLKNELDDCSWDQGSL